MKQLTKLEVYDRLITIASMSPALKRKVGAIICHIDPNSGGYIIVAEGYNYNPSGGPCETEDNLAHPNVIHAEVAAIENLSPEDKAAIDNYSFTGQQNYKLFTTHQPCTGCLAHMRKANLNYEVWRKLMSNNVEDTLKERGSRYGDFADNARVSEALMDILRAEPGYKNLRPVHRSALNVMTQKMARVVNGDPEYKDNWHDIGGYAKLTEDRCIVEKEQL